MTVGVDARLPFAILLVHSEKLPMISHLLLVVQRLKPSIQIKFKYLSNIANGDDTCSTFETVDRMVSYLRTVCNSGVEGPMIVVLRPLGWL